MGTKSKFFRAFVEGQTISDGRKIEADWIDQIVQTFNAQTYSPRVNVEHFKGFSPEPPFNGYGTVVAVKAQTDEITVAGKTEQRRALYAQVDANDQLVGLVAKDQKPFPSVELTDSYAGTGKIGLIGLAFTDSPASIGTQALQFSRSAPGSLFSPSPDAITIEFEVAPADPAKVESAIAGFFNTLSAKFKGGESEKPKEEPKPKAANDNDLAAFATAMGQTVGQAIAVAIKPIADAQAAMQAEFATIKGQLEQTEQPGGFSRTPATGAPGQFLTDC